MAEREKLRSLYAAYAEGNATAVLVEGRYSGVYKETSRRLDAQFCHVWTLRGDVLTGLQQYTDTGQWRDAMGVR